MCTVSVCSHLHTFPKTRLFGLIASPHATDLLRFILVRVHDESPGRRTNQIKWVTRDQREGGLGGRSQNAQVIGIDDLHPIHLIAKQRRRRLKLNFVCGTDVFQVAEESVTVPGNYNVPRFSWKRRALDVSRTQPKGTRAGAL